MVITSKVNFRKPRQKMWGIIKQGSLVQLPYGSETDSNGTVISGWATNCYGDALEQAKILISQGIATVDVQMVEFVPYDFMMQPNV